MANKTAIITGASSGLYLPSISPSFGKKKSRWMIKSIHSGIGRASAIALSKAGWNVVLIARREEKLRETESQCTGPRKLVFSGDVTDQDFIQTSFQQAFSTFGELREKKKNTFPFLSDVYGHHQQAGSISFSMLSKHSDDVDFN